MDLGLTENVGTSGLKFEIWFRKRSQDTWVLQANNAQTKNCWVRTLEKILWNQAIKNRECRLTELSSMGIGSKPNLDLKISEDNILDRQINTTVGHKGEAMRWRRDRPTALSSHSSLLVIDVLTRVGYAIADVTQAW